MTRRSWAERRRRPNRDPGRWPPDAARGSGTDDAITVLVVDDQPIYHEMVRRILAGAPGISVVAVADTVAEALDQARAHEPDVVLMDQQLPDGRGTDAARRLLGVVRHTRVVMVTATVDDRTLTDARKAGCAGYVLKDRLVHDLAGAIRAAHRGETALPDHSVDLFLMPLVEDVPSQAAGSGT